MINIEKKKDCCGCGACQQVCPKKCIQMVEDKEGIPYPVIDKLECIDCGLCERVCPILNVNQSSIPDSVLTYAASNKNDEQRLSSSSGGMFQLLAEYIIKNEGVVFGAKFNDKWEVVHDKATSLDEIEALKRSKYVQSDIRDSYIEAKRYLNKGYLVLFCGTPCQIAGLRSFLRKEYVNLYCVDFICHGIPSRGIWRKYLQEIQSRSTRSVVDGKNTVLSSLKSVPVITGINFREKRKPEYRWQKYGFVVRGFSPSKGEKNSVLWSYYAFDDVYMRSFLHDYILRPSCYACRFRNGGGNSDITLADFWGIEKVCNDPDFISDKGTSWVIIHNEKGKDLFRLLDVKKQVFNLSDGRWANAALLYDWPRPWSRFIYMLLWRYISISTTLFISEFFNTICKHIYSLFSYIKHHIKITALWQK